MIQPNFSVATTRLPIYGKREKNVTQNDTRMETFRQLFAAGKPVLMHDLIRDNLLDLVADAREMGKIELHGKLHYIATPQWLSEIQAVTDNVEF